MDTTTELKPMRDKLQSDNISDLALALSKAQGQLENAKKEANNPFFKSKYATLEATWEACRGPLSANELAVIQTTDKYEKGVMIITTLCHSSGQWIRGYLEVPASKPDAQGMGSAITYGRRYALQAIVGICAEDDDGNAAVKSVETKPNPKSKSTSRNKYYDEISEVMKSQKLSREEVHEIAKSMFKTNDFKKLSESDLTKLIERIKVTNYAPKS